MTFLRRLCATSAVDEMESRSVADTQRRLRARQAGVHWAKGTVLKAGLKIDTHLHSSSLHSQLIKPGLPVLLWSRPMADTSCVRLCLRITQEHRQKWREAGFAASSKCSSTLRASVQLGCGPSSAGPPEKGNACV